MATSLTSSPLPTVLADSLCDFCEPLIKCLTLHDENYWEAIREVPFFSRSPPGESIQKDIRSISNLTPASCQLCHAIMATLEDSHRVIDPQTPPHLWGPEYHLRYPNEAFPVVEYSIFATARESPSGFNSRDKSFRAGGIALRIRRINETIPESWLDRPITSRLKRETLLGWVEGSRQRELGSGPPDSRKEGGTANSLRLIDCEAGCLVMCQQPCQYLALSYVWGKPDPFWMILKRENLNELSKPGALWNASDSDSFVPRVTLDCIQLATMLNFRYIWVDALCILQDDEEEKSHLIARMHQIYQDAFATVILTHCSTSNSPVPGIAPRQSKQSIDSGLIQIGDLELKITTSRDNLGSLVESGIWRLYLTPQEAFFCDRTASFREGNAAMFEIDPGPGDGHDVLLKSSVIPLSNDHGEYVRRVEAYMRRDFTNPADILNAFTGVYEDFNSRSRSPHRITETYGAAVDILPEILLWLAAKPLGARPPSGLQIPSWSWASARSYVLFDHDCAPLGLRIYVGVTQHALGPFPALDAAHIGHEGLDQARHPEPRSAQQNASIVLATLDSAAAESMQALELQDCPSSSVMKNHQERAFHNRWLRSPCAAREPVDLQDLSPGHLGFWAPCISFAASLHSVLRRGPLTSCRSEAHAHQQRCGLYSPDEINLEDPTELIILGYQQEGKVQYRGISGVGVWTDEEGISRRVGFCKFYWCRREWYERIEDGDVDFAWRWVRLA